MIASTHPACGCRKIPPAQATYFEDVGTTAGEKRRLIEKARSSTYKAAVGQAQAKAKSALAKRQAPAREGGHRPPLGRAG